MSSRRRRRFVVLASLLRRRHPDVDALAAVRAGRVTVDGTIALNPDALVREDAAVRVRRAEPLRGTGKLAHALTAFGRTDLSGRVALDVGAAAGGFTQALLDAGCAHVYAVDAGFGQLRGWLRADPRVVSLERTNLGALGRREVPEVLDVVTMDLSYLALADAIPQLGRLELQQGADLLALVKPTFELARARLAADDVAVNRAVALVVEAVEACGWANAGTCASAVSGSRGAIEAFVHATWRGDRGGSPRYP